MNNKVLTSLILVVFLDSCSLNKHKDYIMEKWSEWDVSPNKLMALATDTNSQFPLDSVYCDVYGNEYGAQYSLPKVIRGLYFYKIYLVSIFLEIYTHLGKNHKSLEEQTVSSAKDKIDEIIYSYKWLEEIINLSLIKNLNERKINCPDKPYFFIFADGTYSVLPFEEFSQIPRKENPLENFIEYTESLAESNLISYEEFASIEFDSDIHTVH